MSTATQPLRKLTPPWARDYHRGKLPGDLTAGLVVAMLLVPQSMAYAALAGLPPHIGLYASVLPLIAYALAGSSAVLAVGPVAVVALMTASALEPIAEPGSAAYIAAAATLALISGAMLLAAGLLRLGALASFLSHPVISGFTSGAAVLIIVSQLGPLVGVQVDKGAAVTMLVSISQGISDIDPRTAALGLGALVLLWLARPVVPALLRTLGLPAHVASLLTRLTPMVLVLAATALVAATGWHHQGLAVAGELPQGLPALALPALDWPLVSVLLLPALLISILGFMESVSVASALARQRHERVDADAELRGLGLANLSGGLSAAMPVTGGFSRTAVNADAGAGSPLAGVITAVIIALVLVFATGVFATLPMAVLAAIIIVAVSSLIDVHSLKRLWRYDRADALAMSATAAGVILLGVEAGLATGVVLSLGVVVWRAGRPHIAEVGQVPGTEHFRNILRHTVHTRNGLLMLRVDENLFFGNAEAVAVAIEQRLQGREPPIRDLVLIMSSVSHIDATALETLEALEHTLAETGTRLHLAEVKGPVMDRLRDTPLLRELSGTVWLSTQAAFNALPAASR